MTPLTGAVGGAFAALVGAQILPGEPVLEYAEYSVCFAAAVILTIVLLAATVFVGLASRWTDDEDREWWARFGGWVLIAISGWAAMSVLVVFGPLVLV